MPKKPRCGNKYGFSSSRSCLEIFSASLILIFGYGQKLSYFKKYVVGTEKIMISEEGGVRQTNLEDVYAESQKILAAADRDELDEITYRAGARHIKFGKPPHIALKFFNENHIIRLDNYDVILPDGREVPLKEKNLLLHYLLQAKTVPLAGQLISFKETPDGNFYYSKFAERVERPIREAFGDNPELLLKLKDRLDADTLDQGDAALRLFALPFVPLTCIVWKGDEEFPPSAQVLLDKTITEYLPTEDIIFLCQTAASRLSGMAKEIE
jgi:hypothetical protein